MRALLAAQRQNAYEKYRDAVMKLPPDITMAALERSLTGRRQADQAGEEVIVRLATKRDATPRS